MKARKRSFMAYRNELKESRMEKGNYLSQRVKNERLAVADRSHKMMEKLDRSKKAVKAFQDQQRHEIMLR